MQCREPGGLLQNPHGARSASRKTANEACRPALGRPAARRGRQVPKMSPMSAHHVLDPLGLPSPNRRIWLAYGGGCLVAWLLYVLAGAEFQRGLWQLWEAVYQATLSLWPPMLLGLAIFPWVRSLQVMELGTPGLLVLHALAALLFGGLWQVCEFSTSWLLFGLDHASAVLVQTLLWRAIWGVFVYGAIATGFTAMLQTQRARAAALAAAQ